MRALLFCFCWLMCLAPAQANECLDPGSMKPRRVALVIGNSAYQDTPLDNPVRDAGAVAKVLKCLGFVVTELNDVNFEAFEVGVKSFRDRIHPGDWVAIYYSGHGIQVYDEQRKRPINFLIPVDNGKQSSAADVRKNGISFDWVRESVHEQSPGLAIFLLDACRDSPRSLATVVKSFGATKGLARVENKFSDEIIQFATGSDDVAEQGEPGALSPFVIALNEHLPVRGRSLTDSLTAVIGRVEELTEEVRAKRDLDPQRPVLLPNLSRPVFLVPGPASPAPPPREQPVTVRVPAPPKPAPAEPLEIEFFDLTPRFAKSGDRVTVEWRAKGAEWCELDHPDARSGAARVGLDGSERLTARRSGDVVLECAAGDQRVTASEELEIRRGSTDRRETTRTPSRTSVGGHCCDPASGLRACVLVQPLPVGQSCVCYGRIGSGLVCQ